MVFIVSNCKCTHTPAGEMMNQIHLFPAFSRDNRGVCTLCCCSGNMLAWLLLSSSFWCMIFSGTCCSLGSLFTGCWRRFCCSCFSWITRSLTKEKFNSKIMILKRLLASPISLVQDESRWWFSSSLGHLRAHLFAFAAHLLCYWVVVKIMMAFWILCVLASLCLINQLATNGRQPLDSPLFMLGLFVRSFSLVVAHFGWIFLLVIAN